MRQYVNITVILHSATDHRERYFFANSPHTYQQAVDAVLQLTQNVTSAKLLQRLSYLANKTLKYGEEEKENIQNERFYATFYCEDGLLKTVNLYDREIMSDEDDAQLILFIRLPEID